MKRSTKSSRDRRIPTPAELVSSCDPDKPLSHFFDAVETVTAQGYGAIVTVHRGGPGNTRTVSLGAVLLPGPTSREGRKEFYRYLEEAAEFYEMISAEDVFALHAAKERPQT